jgi:hypothetical protein
MSIELRVYPDRRLVYSRASGVLTVADVMRGRDALTQILFFDRSFDHLVDLRAVDTSQLSANDIRTIAGSSVLAATARRAIIAADEATFGLSRMYQILREAAGGQETRRVFRTLDDALRWLGREGLDPGRDEEEGSTVEAAVATYVPTINRE